MAAKNRDFGRFVTTWYNVHCKHTLFFEFLGLLNDFLWKKLGFGGLGLGFGGREGALASALIPIYPITLNGYIQSWQKKSKKINKKKSNKFKKN